MLDGKKIKDLCDKLVNTIIPLVNKDNFSLVCRKLGKIFEVLGQMTPLGIGKAMMLLANLLQEVEGDNANLGLIKEAHILALEIAADKIEGMIK